MSTPRKDELTKSYQKTMTAMRTELNGFDKLFSRLCHSQIISASLSLLRSTLFRGRALLLGSVTSSIALVFFYLYAKLDGYTVAGSEPLVAFIAGWTIGFMIDIFSKK